MKQAYFYLFFFSLWSLGQAQDINHYKRILDTASSKDVQLLALDSLLSKTFRTDPEAFILYSKRYIKTATELNRIEDAARGAMNIQHPLTNSAGDPLGAILIIDDVLARKNKIKDSLLLGGLYMKRGRAYSKVNLQRAIEDYTTSLSNFSKTDTLHRADVFLFRGQAHANKGQFVAAREDYDTAYRLYDAKKEYQYMIYARQGMISMFSMNGFYDKAKEERDMLIQKMIDLDFTSYLAGEYYNQALDYRNMQQRKMEYQSLREAEKHLDKIQNNSYVAIGVHSLFVSYYCDHMQLDEAKKHLDFIESLNYDFNGNLPSELNYLSARIDYLIAIGEYATALELAAKKLGMAKQLEFEDEIMATYETLAEINYRTKNYQESIENYRAASILKDSIYTKTAINSLAYYQTLYEIERKEKDLIEKSANIRLLETANRTVKWAMILGGIALVFGFVLLIVYRNQQELKRRKVLQDNYTQGLLSSQESERKRISQNLHDGLGQQLLVLKNRLLSLQDLESMRMIDAAIDEVRSISRDLHPFQLQEMGITRAIKNTIAKVDENSKIFITAEIDDIDNLFSKEFELNIYRIVQESLSNILKHSNAKATRISIKKNPDHVFISIRDNGVGFVFTEKYKYPKSLGLKTLMERTKYLKGQMKVSSTINSGTLLEFQIPIVT